VFTAPAPYPAIQPGEQIGLVRGFLTRLANLEGGITEDDELNAQRKMDRKIFSCETDRAEMEEADREAKAKKAPKAPKKKGPKDKKVLPSSPAPLSHTLSPTLFFYLELTG